MKINYQKINLESFERIWDSSHNDNFLDSWPLPFRDTKKGEWEPVFRKWVNVMNEVYIDNKAVGYIFLSLKGDGTAHFGYGLYCDFRGNNLMFQIALDFLNKKERLLSKDIKVLVGTILKDNIPSQRVLTKLGFSYQKEIIETHNDRDIEYFRYTKEIA